jgi:hypothetical protein
MPGHGKVVLRAIAPAARVLPLLAVLAMIAFVITSPGRSKPWLEDGDDLG